MDLNNTPNQSYWFVLREDQNNITLTSNNFTLQNAQIENEARYVVDTSDNRYIRINETPIPVRLLENSDDLGKGLVKPSKEGDNFWDRNKIKLFLTLCLENGIRSPNSTNAKEKSLWDNIANMTGTTTEDCNKKYRNLRRTYLRLLKKKMLGKEIKWVHYNLCENVFKDYRPLSCSALEPWEDDKINKLLSLYIENLSRFRSSEYLQKDVWKDIALQLGTTEYSCYHKFKNLKRTYFNWLERNRDSGKLIKWQYHQYFERIFYNHDLNTGPWDRNKVKVLLETYSQIAHKFRNPKFQKKQLWREIAASVGESPDMCDKKFRNLKQTYIRLKSKADNSGRTITKWRYYKHFEQIYSTQANYSRVDDDHDVTYRCYEENYVKQLLEFYLKHKEKFRDPLTKKKTLWRVIGPKLGLSSEECNRKFRNLKQTYIRIAEKKRETGKSNKWPYYTYFEQIYTEPVSRSNHRSSSDSISISELKKIVQDTIHERKENDKKFDRLIRVVQESNDIQRERNRILKALLERK